MLNSMLQVSVLMHCFLLVKLNTE